MNLLYELEQAANVVRRCEGTPEIQKARMNFIVNLVTILELYSRNIFRYHSDDRFYDESFPLCAILRVAITKREKNMVAKMVQLRNEIVHEGKVTNLMVKEVNDFSSLVSQIINEATEY